MHVENLQQPSFNTSLLGVVQGALDHFGIPCDAPRAFVGSGHAFVINIHPELCPSGPYCWNSDRLGRLFGNLGLDVENLGMYLPSSSSAEEKATVETRVREALDDGAVCSLLHLDNQLILGYDESGFIVAQPWGEEAPSTPARLTYGTWEEFVDGPPVAFFAFRPCEPASDQVILEESIAYMESLWTEPKLHTDAPYGMGPDAYATWFKAIEDHHGDSFGNWWNATVWAECRAMAGKFFAGIGEAAIADQYDQLAHLLDKVADQKLADGHKHKLLEEALALDEECVGLLADLKVEAA